MLLIGLVYIYLGRLVRMTYAAKCHGLGSENTVCMLRGSDCSAICHAGQAGC